MQTLFDGYHRFHRSRWLSERDRYRQGVEHGQHPSALVLACCDSRVDPQMIFDARPGDLFVVRNVANLAPPFREDLPWQETSAAIEFGVRVLKVPQILVLGHGMCGGVRALLDDPPHPHTDFIDDWVELARCACDRAARGEGRFKACEQAVVRLSLTNLATFPWINAAVAGGGLTLSGAYFDIRSGDLEVLQPDGAFVALPTASPRSGGAAPA